MTLYIIRGHMVTAFASAPATSEDELRVRSVEEVEDSGLSAAQMVAIWNAQPGAKPLSKFKDRKTAARRLWARSGTCRSRPNPLHQGRPVLGPDRNRPKSSACCNDRKVQRSRRWPLPWAGSGTPCGE